MEIPFHDFYIGEEISVKKSLMKAKVDERCCVIGTLFKKMELKPSILKEISNSVRTHILSSYPPPSLSLSLCPSIHLPFSEEVTYRSLSHSSSQRQLLPQPPRAKSISSSDSLVVEDSSQRIVLRGDIPSAELVTGKVDVTIQETSSQAMGLVQGAFTGHLA